MADRDKTPPHEGASAEGDGGGKPKTRHQERAERLGGALRANLARRKQQARHRDDEADGEGNGGPDGDEAGGD